VNGHISDSTFNRFIIINSIDRENAIKNQNKDVSNIIFNGDRHAESITPDISISPYIFTKQ